MKATHTQLSPIEQAPLFRCLYPLKTEGCYQKAEIEAAHRARRILIDANMPFLKTFVQKSQHKTRLGFDDLLQEGFFGLERAVMRFDPDKGYAFTTYAVWWIKNYINQAIYRDKHKIYFPIYRVEQLIRIKRVDSDLQQTLKRQPTIEEISEGVGLSPDLVIELLDSSRHTKSLDDEISEGVTLVETISDPLDVQAVAFDAIDKERLCKLLLGTLPERQLSTVALLYGLTEESYGRPLSLTEIGQRLDVSRERVAQIRDQAFGKMRKVANKPRDN